MTLTVKHATLNNGAVADDPNFPIGSDEWDEAHSVTGTLPVANGGTGADTGSDALANLIGGSPSSGDQLTFLSGVWQPQAAAPSTPTAITVANEATDTTCFPLFVTAATGDLGPKSNTGLTFNSATGAFGATSGKFGSVLASSDDSGAIGASGTAFSDLFLASGAVINFNAGNYTITHSAGALTTNGDFGIGSHQFSGSTLNLSNNGQNVIFGNGWADLAAGNGTEFSLGPISSNAVGFRAHTGSVGTFKIGYGDSGSPIAQTLSVQNVVAGTSNTAGVDFTIAGSKGTGTGEGGKILFQTAPKGTTGTSQNSLVTALTVHPAGAIQLVGTTVANLPATPAAGMVGYVTDGSTGTWGATQTGSGSTKTLVWYNGTNWTVIGA